MDRKKNYITQKKLKKTQYGYSQRGAYFDERKGRYIRIDRGHYQSSLKKRISRLTRRRLNKSLEPYSKSNITNKISEFWWDLD